jgi:hypothetical protein
MGFEKWAEDGRLAAVCDGCSARARLEERAPKAATATLLVSGWREGARTLTGHKLLCSQCARRGPPALRKVGTEAPATTRGAVVAGRDGKYTLSFEDAQGRKRFVLWKAPTPQRELAERALRTGESISIRLAGTVRVGFRGTGAERT